MAALSKATLMSAGPTDNIGSPPASPVEWMDFLYGKLGSRLLTYKRYGDYYDGSHKNMAFAQDKYRSAYAELFKTWNDNFCGLIVDSVNERLSIEGFRFGDEAVADTEAQEIWQRNFMDSEANSAHLDSMINGSSYAIVWADDKGKATITVESAERVVVQYKPGSRRDIEAAAKFYLDDWGRSWVTLWLEDGVYTGSPKLGGYQLDSAEENPLGVVPVVPIHNRARLVGEPLSDLHTVIPIADAINKTVADALIASEYAAWPQRYVTGLEIQEDDQGNPVEPFKVAVDKLLQAEDPQASFGQFEAADLSNYCDLVNMLVQHLATVSRIPFHYFLLNGGQAPSGEAITSAEAGLISKTRERMVHFGEAWERVMRLCFQVEGNAEKAEAFDAEVMWRDPENRTEAQHIDALLKLKMIDVPKQQLWLDAGYTSAQIANFQGLLEKQAKTEMDMANKYMTNQEKALMTAPAAPGQAQKPGRNDPAAKAASKAPQGNAGNAARKSKPPANAK
ncbi:phage portal protein [Streptomyces sp. BI20]|uniref:phage portal protein n=1 Tax=Streptomyces sp. BI20 TaxID=3403460 RepID=UPI003C726101